MRTFLGEVQQIGIVTRDHRRTVAGLMKLGIGPWSVSTFDSSNLTERMYRGRPAHFSMRICGARSAGLAWEVIEPIDGPSIYTEFLERHGDGVQHLAFSYGALEYQECLQRFAALGYQVIQSGVYCGAAQFHYFGTEADATTVFEVFHAPVGFVFPAPEAWISGEAP